MNTKPIWTLEQGLELARQVEPLAVECGFHVALGGGVMLRGESAKDLDLFFYPHKKPHAGNGILLIRLVKFGFTLPKLVDRYGDSPDQKEVRYSYFNNKRVDMFFVS